MFSSRKTQQFSAFSKIQRQHCQTPLFHISTGMWPSAAPLPLPAGPRDRSDSAARPSAEGGDSELQRFPRATGTEGLQKTPEQSNSVSASSSFQKHIEKRIILGQSFKIHKWHFLKAQERKKKGLRGIWNYFKPSPNLVQDANMQITIRAGAYFYSASP